MAPHQEYQTAAVLVPRYEVKHDGDGDMLFLENQFTGEAFVLCGTPDEIHALLENAISHIAHDEVNRMKPTMKPIQALIQKAHNKGLLRFAAPNLVWDDQPANRQRQFELGRTGMTGVEFGYILSTDEITWAIQSIDGVELDLDDFVVELQRAVGVEDQPCQQYTRARVIVDEEPEVTDYNDKELTFIVTQVTTVSAKDKLEAIERVNNMHGSCELVSSYAHAKQNLYRVGAVHEILAEDSQHAVEQFYDTISDKESIVNLIEEVE